jgi:hypothetical protein
MDEYEKFSKEMHEKYPKIFSGPYDGFSVGPGWYQIIRSLCGNIQSHIDHRNCAREKLLENNPWNHPIPEHCEQVVAEQVKEKFGGLRFYYSGGDDVVNGMVNLAESWASHTCESCGDPGTNKSIRGWLTTLCDVHYNMRIEKIKED